MINILMRVRRQNQAVIAAASTVFQAIVQALEAETLQGHTAQRVVIASKRLVQMAGIDANGILSTLGPETQDNVRTWFA